MEASFAIPSLAEEIYQEIQLQLKSCNDPSKPEDYYDDLMTQITTLKDTLQATSQVQVAKTTCEWFNRVVNLSIQTLSKQADQKVFNICQQIKQLEFPIFKPENNSSSWQPTFDSSLMTLLSNQLLTLLDTEPQTWHEWVGKKGENQIGYLMRFYSFAHYPLSPENALMLNKTLLLLKSGNIPSDYSKCQESIIEAFTKLLTAQTQSEAKQILSHVIHQEPLRSVIINEIRSTLHPIIRYLKGEETHSPQQMILQIRAFRDVLRRWTFIEKDHRLGSQCDPAECLHSLFDFLQHPHDRYSYSQVGTLVWKADIDLQESHWTCQTIDLNDDNVETKRILNKLIKHFRKESSSNFSSEERLEVGKRYAAEIIQSGAIKDEKQQEIDDLPSLEEVLKPHTEKHEFPFCMHTVVKDGNLLPDQALENLLQSFFKDVDSFTGYRVHESAIQKVTVPVLERNTEFKGNLPEVFILQPMAVFHNDYQMNLPEVKIPAEITFAGHTYVLSKSIIKTGNQHLGHYTFCAKTEEGKSQYADSLELGKFRLSDIPLNQLMSGKKNVALLEYQRKDIDPKRYVIKQKLYQGDDNLCYLVQALYFIYGNPCFASINQVELDHSSHCSLTASAKEEDRSKDENNSHTMPNSRKRKAENISKSSQETKSTE